MEKELDLFRSELGHLKESNSSLRWTIIASIKRPVFPMSSTLQATSISVLLFLW